MLDHLNTRIVVPLLSLDVAPLPAKILSPIFDVQGEGVAMATQYLAAVPAQLLKTPVANLETRRDDVVAAPDLLFQGF